MRRSLWTVVATVLIIGLLAWPVAAFAQEVAKTESGIDWEGLIVKVVLAVLGILVTLFASKINSWLGKYFDAKWKRDGAIAISQLAWDAVSTYAAKHPEHEWPEIPLKLIGEFIERLRSLDLASGEGAAMRALSGAAMKLPLKLEIKPGKIKK